MRRSLVVSIVLACAVGAHGQDDRFFVTGIEAKYGKLEAGRCYGVEFESTFGGDANGDGDATDSFVRAFDPATGLVTNLPFAVRTATSFELPVAAGGDFELIAVFESQHFNVDRNGDGDTADDVLCIRRVSTGVATIVPLAVEPEWLDVAGDGSVATLKVREAEQGADLDGNGAAGGTLFVALDPATAAWSVLGATTTAANSTGAEPLSGGGVVLVASESDPAPGVDLNGDGDTWDWVPRTFDLASGTLTTVPVAVLSGADTIVLPGEQRLAWKVHESSSGAIDLNGDGDTFDLVPHLYDRATLALTNLGVYDIAFNARRVNADHVLLTPDDANNNKDFNGDGDLLDSAVLVYEIATGAVTTIDPAGMKTSSSMMLGDGFFSFELWESQQSPPADLNGDGDLWDRIAGVYVIATGEKIAIPIALHANAQAVHVAGTHLVLVADETHNNGTNLNYDDTIADSCAFAYDVAERHLLNLARSLQPPNSTLWVVSGRLPFVIAEAAENSQSWNGDADAFDLVPAIFDAVTGSVCEPGFAIGSTWFEEGGNALFWVDENGEGHDVDGDGKLATNVLAMYAPQPLGCGAFAMYGSGCPTSAGGVPELEAHGCAAAGGEARIQVRGGVPGQHAFLLVGLQQASLPLPGGCTLWASPLLPVVIGPFFLPLNGLLSGATLIASPVPANALSATLRMQAFITDPALAKGWAASNGLEVSIAP